MASTVPNAEFLDAIEALMRQARSLGLYRTTEKLHAALNEARSETWEATPTNPVSVRWTIGPVTDQA